MKKRLAGFEELVLLATASLGEEAYGVTVQQRLEAETGSAVALGAVYAVLHRLQRKGYVRSAWGEATPQRGGDRKSTRLNSSHMSISYAVFCLKKKKKKP